MDLLKLCKALIKIKSCSLIEGTNEIMGFVGPIANDLGARVSTQEVMIEGKANLNLLAQFDGRNGNDSPLLINTHLDTVSPGDTRLWTKCRGNPFNATVHGKTLYGLGVADTKLAIACALTAIRELQSKNKRDFRFRQPLSLMATAGEEVGLIGARHALTSGFARAKYALVSEPSELNLVWAHKGLAACIIEFSTANPTLLSETSRGTVLVSQLYQGEAAHSSTPALGVNAIEKALVGLEKYFRSKQSPLEISFLKGGTATNIIPAQACLGFRVQEDKVKALLKQDKTFKLEKNFDGPAFSPLVFKGILAFSAKMKGHSKLLAGKKNANFSPPFATTSLTLAYPGEIDGEKIATSTMNLIYDHRYITPGDGKVFHDTLERCASETENEFPGLRVRVHMERLNEPMFGDRKSPFVQDMLKLQKALRLPAALQTKSGCTEGGLYAAHGIETIVVGPGRALNNIHKPNEKVALSQLKDAVRFYKAAIEKFCL